jgi:hypothetical protein
MLGMKKIASAIVIMLLCSLMVFVFTSKVYAQDISSGLVGYWKFDEGSGNVTADSSGNGNNGILINSPAWVDGIYGKALSFNGVDQYVNITENTDLNPHTSNWTISAWVNIAQLTNNGNGNYGFVVVGKRQTASDTSLTLLAVGGSSPTSQASFAFIYDGTLQLAGAATPLMNVFGWDYVSGVRIGGDLYVYVNGTEYGPNNYIPYGYYLTASTDVNSTTPIQLGHDGAWSSYYNGTIGEVRIYNRALSQQEIQEIMTVPEFPSFLIVPLFMMATLLVVVIYRKETRPHSIR